MLKIKKIKTFDMKDKPMKSMNRKAKYKVPDSAKISLITIGPISKENRKPIPKRVNKNLTYSQIKKKFIISLSPKLLTVVSSRVLYVKLLIYL